MQEYYQQNDIHHVQNPVFERVPITRAVPVPTPYVKKVPIIRKIPVPVPNKKQVGDNKIVNQTDVKIVGYQIKKKKEKEDSVDVCPNCYGSTYNGYSTKGYTHDSEDCDDPTHSHYHHKSSFGQFDHSNPSHSVQKYSDEAYHNLMLWKQKYDADKNKNIRYTDSFSGTNVGSSAFY